MNENEDVVTSDDIQEFENSSSESSESSTSDNGTSDDFDFGFEDNSETEADADNGDADVSNVSDLLAAIESGDPEKAKEIALQKDKGIAKLLSQKASLAQELESEKASKAELENIQNGFDAVISDIKQGNEQAIALFVNEIQQMTGLSFTELAQIAEGIDLSTFKPSPKPQKADPLLETLKTEVESLKTTQQKLQEIESEKAWIERNGKSVAKQFELQTGLKLDPSLFYKARTQLTGKPSIDDIHVALMATSPSAYLQAKKAAEGEALPRSATAPRQGGGSPVTPPRTDGEWAARYYANKKR